MQRKRVQDRRHCKILREKNWKVEIFSYDLSELMLLAIIGWWLVEGTKGKKKSVKVKYCCLNEPKIIIKTHIISSEH